jgi:hypothetical protein
MMAIAVFVEHDKLRRERWVFWLHASGWYLELVLEDYVDERRVSARHKWTKQKRYSRMYPRDASLLDAPVIPAVVKAKAEVAVMARLRVVNK